MADPASPALPGLDDGWTCADSAAAKAEGWDVFDCDGSDNGRVQLCRDEMPPGTDEPDPEPGDPIFDGDDAAWSHVAARAGEGSALHLRALRFVERHNPLEFSAFCVAQGFGWPGEAPVPRFRVVLSHTLLDVPAEIVATADPGAAEWIAERAAAGRHDCDITEFAVVSCERAEG